MVLWTMTMMAAMGSTDEAWAFPCPDGLSTCEVDGRRIGPGLTRDTLGMPVDAHSRLGWFDLRPREVFSPFQQTRTYAGPVGEPAPQGIAAPAAVREPTPPRVPSTTPDPRSKVVVPPVQPTSPVPVEKGQGTDTPAATVDCDPRALETRASMGRLTADERTCLDATIRDADARLTERSRSSRVRMADAFAGGRAEEHAELLDYHLERIDQSDPDLCMRQARRLAKAGQTTAALRWVDTALENRTQWHGKTFVQRMGGAHALRARVAHDAWQRAEQRTAQGTPEDRETTDALRHQAKTAAREWLDYARGADLDTRSAEDLCRSAAGNRAFCR
jgi:hypothetical protein